MPQVEHEQCALLVAIIPDRVLEGVVEDEGLARSPLRTSGGKRWMWAGEALIGGGEARSMGTCLDSPATVMPHRSGWGTTSGRCTRLRRSWTQSRAGKRRGRRLEACGRGGMRLESSAHRRKLAGA